MRIAMCLMKRLGWWCEDMQSFKNYYLVGRAPLTGGPEGPRCISVWVLIKFIGGGEAVLILPVHVV